jgi:hypothetical protein
MKTKIYIILMVGLLVSVQHVLAQVPEKQTRKEAKKERQENREKLTSALLDKQSFVLRANYIDNHRGRRFHVNPTINFLMIDKDRATIQLGNGSGIGHNGVGGITTVGRITSWDLTTRKNNSHYLNLNILTSIGHYDIRVHISPNGNANATLSGIRAGRLTYSGSIVPVEGSKVYKGRAI